MKVTNLMVMSLDGEITTQPQENSAERLKIGLTNQDDQELLEEEIKLCDAVIIGAESVRWETKILELMNYEGKYPTWCVFTNKGLDPSLEFWRQNRVPRMLVSQKPCGHSSEVENLPYGNSPPGKFLLRELKRRGFKKILLLGGGLLNQVFYSEGLVDELKLTVAPLLVAKGLNRLVGPGLEVPVHFELLASEAKGSFLFLHYKVVKSVS